MSVESMAIVLHHSRAKGTAKLVLLGIANHDGDGGAFPKVATLAKYANVHPRRIPAVLETLGELGEIVIHQGDGGTRRTPGHMRPNLYELVLECPADCDRTKNHRIEGERLGRSYKGQHDPAHVKDPARVARGKAGRERSLTRTAAVADVVLPPTPSVENSTTPSAENSTTPSAENSTTKNHQIEPPLENSSVSTSPGAGAPVENPPATGRRIGITEEQMERNRRGAAAARAALKGEPVAV